MNLDNIVLFNKDYKKSILRCSSIDKGIKELCNAINNIDDLVTINSCQGRLCKDESNNHCPKTYVDFYVLNHNYNIANNLFLNITRVFGSVVECSVNFEPDFDIIIDEYEYEFTKENGKIKIRYSLELAGVNEWIEDSIITLQKIISFIKDYKMDYIDIYKPVN